MPHTASLPEDLSAFADALLEARVTHRPIALPQDFVQRCSPEQGRAIGARNADLLAQRLGGGLAGVKLGATNPEAMRRLGLTEPFDGAMLAARVFASPATLPFDDFILCIVEAELGVRFRTDIGGTAQRPTHEALSTAIDAIFPVIELAETRLLDWSSAPPAAIFADMAYFGALVTGEPLRDWEGLDLASATVRLTVHGQEIRSGTGAAVMGNPLDALADYIARIGARGQVLRAGSIVSTGTWTQPYVASRGEHLSAEFGAIGRVSVSLR